MIKVTAVASRARVAEVISWVMKSVVEARVHQA